MGSLFSAPSIPKAPVAPTIDKVNTPDKTGLEANKKLALLKQGRASTFLTGTTGVDTTATSAPQYKPLLGQ